MGTVIKMGLFRRRSDSSPTSTKLKIFQRNGVLSPDVPEIPPPPIQTNPSSVGPRGAGETPTNSEQGYVSYDGGSDRFSTSVSQISGLTHRSGLAAGQSTAPSSVEAVSVIGFPDNGMPAANPQVQLNGHRISI